MFVSWLISASDGINRVQRRRGLETSESQAYSLLWPQQPFSSSFHVAADCCVSHDYKDKESSTIKRIWRRVPTVEDYCYVEDVLSVPISFGHPQPSNTQMQATAEGRILNRQCIVSVSRLQEFSS